MNQAEPLDLPESDLELLELEDLVTPASTGEQVAQAVIIGGVTLLLVAGLCC